MTTKCQHASRLSANAIGDDCFKSVDNESIVDILWILKKIVYAQILSGESSLHLDILWIISGVMRSKHIK